MCMCQSLYFRGQQPYFHLKSRFFFSFKFADEVALTKRLRKFLIENYATLTNKHGWQFNTCLNQNKWKIWAIFCWLSINKIGVFCVYFLNKWYYVETKWENEKCFFQERNIWFIEIVYSTSSKSCTQGFFLKNVLHFNVGKNFGWKNDMQPI